LNSLRFNGFILLHYYVNCSNICIVRKVNREVHFSVVIRLIYMINISLFTGEYMGKKEIEQKTEELLMPILSEFGFKLWDVEYVKEGAEYYLRAYIDKEGGITIDDCVDVSRRLSDKLDEEDYIDGEYILEVSSPGLGRTLKRDRDFENSIDREIDIKLYKAIDKVKEFYGVLKEFNKDTIVVEIDGELKDFLRSDLASVKLHVEF